jgi:hypothetical protein
VNATVLRVLPHHHNKASMMTPLTSFYRSNRRTLIKAKDVIEVLHNVMRINVHHTGIDASEISARSLRADRDVVLLHSRVDLDDGSVE